MKIRKSILSLFAATCLCAITGCKSGDDGHDELGHHHHHEHEHAEGEGGHEGEEIVLEPEVAERMGVETDTIQPGEFHNVVKVAGTIMPNPEGSAMASARTAGIVTLAPGITVGKSVKRGELIATVSATSVSGGDSNAAARARLEAARKELDRLTPLHADGIVSARQYNEARQAYEQARAEYSPVASSGSVTAPISGVITSLDATSGSFVDAGAPVATIGSSHRLTLRADVPERYHSFLSQITDARMSIPAQDLTLTLSDHGGRKVTGSDAGAVALPGYVPVYFSFDNPGGTVYAGAAAEVYLIGGSRSGVITVPVTALSEQQGDMFVYVKLDEECYQKVGVKTGLGDGERIEILSGLNGGEEVVVKGTTTVRLAETSGVVPEGHSHSH